MDRIRILAVIGMLVCAIAAFSADKPAEWNTLKAPEEIGTKQEILATPEGWTAAKEQLPNRLAAVVISEGPPEDKATLVYDDEARHNKKLAATWHFDAASKERFWIECSYSGTNIVISRQLPEGIKELRVTYDEEVKTDGFSTIEKIEYR